MSKIGVRLKIDVSKIDKARLFRGQKGVYLDATVFIDPDQKDQYENNGMITQDITKEEKDSGVKGPILGNVQVFWKEQQQQAPQQYQQQAPQQQAPQQQQAGQSPHHEQNQLQQAPDDNFDDDIPF